MVIDRSLFYRPDNLLTEQKPTYLIVLAPKYQETLLLYDVCASLTSIGFDLPSFNAIIAEYISDST